MRLFKIPALLLLLLVNVGAYAEISLDDAKARGLVGEDAGGYLAAVGDSPDRDVRALISEINDKRRAQYEKIAASNKIELNAVEQLAGKKAIERTEPGLFIRLPDSSWQRK